MANEWRNWKYENVYCEWDKSNPSQWVLNAHITLKNIFGDDWSSRTSEFEGTIEIDSPAHSGGQYTEFKYVRINAIEITEDYLSYTLRFTGIPSELWDKRIRLRLYNLYLENGRYYDFNFVYLFQEGQVIFDIAPAGDGICFFDNFSENNINFNETRGLWYKNFNLGVEDDMRRTLRDKLNLRSLEDLGTALNALADNIPFFTIVEKGVDNGWNYIKYSDGTYQAWQIFNGKSVFTAGYAGGYTAASVWTPTIPSFNKQITSATAMATTFTGATPSSTTVYSSHCLNRCYLGGNLLRWQAWRAASSSSQIAVEYSAQITGTW